MRAYSAASSIDRGFESAFAGNVPLIIPLLCKIQFTDEMFQTKVN